MTGRGGTGGADAPLVVRLTLAERHDLFTPLNQIIGYCEMLLEDAEASHADLTQTETLRKVVTAANDLHRQLNEVLSRASPGDGHGESTE